MMLNFDLQEVQTAMDHGHSLLRLLLDSSEKTLPNTNTKGSQVIRQEIETAKNSYENIITEISQVIYTTVTDNSYR